MQKKYQTTYAVPLDIFRILLGFLCILFFIRSIIDAPFFLENFGLINHDLVRDIFWYTWQPLFHPSMPDFLLYCFLYLGLSLSLSLVIGFKSRLCAFCLYLIVVSLYRYQFLVFFVDDVVLHLLLFWCFILPIGNTLTLGSWLKDKGIKEKWIETKVDGFTQNLLLFNIALIYFIAGVSKYTSKLWLNGSALFATLKLPLSWISEYPIENFQILLQAGNYLALLFEPLFVLLVILKPWNKLKLMLGFAFIFFHLTILLTLDISIANIGCLILAPIIFRDEIMDIVKRKSKSAKAAPKIVAHNRLARIVATYMIIFLTGAMLCALTQDQWREAKRISGKDKTAEVKISSADSGGKIQTFFYGGLWIIGLAQGYRLLDWIDERNFYQKIRVVEIDGELKKEYKRDILVPNGMRGSLIFSYISDVTWMYVNPQRIEELRSDLRLRMQKRFCKKSSPKVKVEVWHTIARVNSFHFKKNEPEILFSFHCKNTQAQVARQ